mgnify:CR=1 FL=1
MALSTSENPNAGLVAMLVVSKQAAIFDADDTAYILSGKTAMPPTSPSAATKNSGVDLGGRRIIKKKSFVTGMFERYPLNRTTKADLVASLDEAIHMVHETDTRDTG